MPFRRCTAAVIQYNQPHMKIPYQHSIPTHLSRVFIHIINLSYHTPYMMSSIDLLLGSKAIQLKIIAANGTFPFYVQFNCDASATAITTAFSALNGPNTTVSVVQYGASNYSIGYSDQRTIGKNWYRPIVMSTPPGVRVTLSTLQEGGYANSHYNNTYVVTPLIQSLWVRPIGMINTATIIPPPPFCVPPLFCVPPPSIYNLTVTLS